METQQTEIFDSREALSHIRSMHQRVLEVKKNTDDEHIVFPEYSASENSETSKARRKTATREIN